MNITDRFLHYVSFHTTSDENTGMNPSTPGQMVFAKALAEELVELGLEDVSLDDNGYLMATLPANTDESKPTIGFIAHMDTSPDASGKHIKPRIVKNYDGNNILLNEEKQIWLDTTKYPEIQQYKGQDIIVTDGTTLLGADDKAGIAEIMTMAEYFLTHPSEEHGKIRIAFTPDEEIGRGADLLNIESFGADWAYTIDGGEIGELEYENFNAASAELLIYGRGIHPGYAKGKMINASRVACEFVSMLPSHEIPEMTGGYEGFFHMTSMEGSVEESKMKFIIRDHDWMKFQEKKEVMRRVVDSLTKKYPGIKMELTIKDQYRNMIEKIKPVMHVIDLAKRAMETCDVTPVVRAIRGGTDGANLSFKGLPCPNLFAGGLNFHGCYEFVPIPSMRKAVEVLIAICKLEAGSH